MKRWFFNTFFILHSSFFILHSQNLVPNGSFELYSSCPPFNGINDAIGWINPTTYSPDYYNSCSFSSGPGDGNSVPNNWYGSMNAKDGVAYSGIIFHISTDGREYIQTELIDSLIAGKKYLVTFYVSGADSNSYAVNDVGAYFSNLAVGATNNLVLPYIPQVKNNGITNPLSLMGSWIKVSDTLIAQGGERFITIGNFKNDISTDTVGLNNGTNWISFSYYYIDDISVIPVDTLLGGIPNSIFSNANLVSIYPNPSSVSVSIKSNFNIYSIKVFNLAGDVLLESSGINSTDFLINTRELESGLYYIKICLSDNKSVFKLLIIN